MVSEVRLIAYNFSWKWILQVYSFGIPLISKQLVNILNLKLLLSCFELTDSVEFYVDIDFSTVVARTFSLSSSSSSKEGRKRWSQGISSSGTSLSYLPASDFEN